MCCSFQSEVSSPALCCQAVENLKDLLDYILGNLKNGIMKEAQRWSPIQPNTKAPSAKKNLDSMCVIIKSIEATPITQTRTFSSMSRAEQNSEQSGKKDNTIFG